jgi:sugar/nucleoside kinase (ribokinase family)
MSGRPFDLVVAGELNIDIVVTGSDVRPVFGQVEKLVDGILLTVGSSSAITACGAARLGLRVAFVGVVGDDSLGRWMLDALATRGIDVDACRVDRERPTGATVVLARSDDRAMLTTPGTMASLSSADLPDRVLGRARHLHVGAIYLQDALRPELADVFRRARRLELSTSFDPNWDPHNEWNGGIDAILSSADIVLANRAEGRHITRIDDDLGAARALADRGATPSYGRERRGAAQMRPTVIIKLGPAGALAVRDDQIVRVGAPDVAMVDTIGAGDSFNAGFLAGTLTGRPLGEALRLAVACGSIALRAVGGTDGQATLVEAQDVAARLSVITEAWADEPTETR